MQINVHKVNRVKINNLKIVQDLGIIGEEESKAKVKKNLNM